MPGVEFLLARLHAKLVCRDPNSLVMRTPEAWNLLSAPRAHSFDLVQQHISAPAVIDCGLYVIIALFVVFNFIKN